MASRRSVPQNQRTTPLQSGNEVKIRRVGRRDLRRGIRQLTMAKVISFRRRGYWLLLLQLS
jgi:hypothetical protein